MNCEILNIEKKLMENYRQKDLTEHKLRSLYVIILEKNTSETK